MEQLDDNKDSILVKLKLILNGVIKMQKENDKLRRALGEILKSGSLHLTAHLATEALKESNDEIP